MSKLTTDYKKMWEIVGEELEKATAELERRDKRIEEWNKKFDDLWLISTAHALDADRYRKALEEIVLNGHEVWGSGKKKAKCTSLCSACIALATLKEGV